MLASLSFSWHDSLHKPEKIMLLGRPAGEVRSFQLAWNILGSPPEGLGEVVRERGVWYLLRLQP